MIKEMKSTGAPKPIGPYSQAVLIDESGLLFTAGQIALDAATGLMAPGGIEEQTAKVLENLKAVIMAAGGNMSCVVKTSIFLKEMADFQKVNEVYGRFFDTPPYPARSTVQVANLPKGALVEIEAVAKLP
jgi:2-iminobutanoate/2-iminopropanoate deaminase